MVQEKQPLGSYFGRLLYMRGFTVVCPTPFRAKFAASFLTQFSLSKFLLLAVANCFELRSQSRKAGAINVLKICPCEQI